MTVYVVTYDLNKQGQNYECITERLKSLPYFHAQKSVWFVEYGGSADALVAFLMNCLDENDRLFVSEITDNWSGFNMPKGEAWLNARV